MTKKTLWIDTETTGLYPGTHCIIEFAAIAEIDGVIKDTVTYRMSPAGYEVTEAAMKVNQLDLKELTATGLPQKDFLLTLMQWMSTFVDCYNKADKFLVAGHKVSFDTDFLFRTAAKEQVKFLGSYLGGVKIDTLYLAHVCHYEGLLTLPDYKLTTLTEHFQIPIEAHTALGDIRAARLLYRKLLDLLKG